MSDVLCIILAIYLLLGIISYNYFLHQDDGDVDTTFNGAIKDMFLTLALGGITFFYFIFKGDENNLNDF